MKDAVERRDPAREFSRAFVVIFAATSAVVGLLSALAFVHAFADAAAGPTSATLTDAVNLLLGMVCGGSLTAFCFMLARPTPSAFGISAACVLAGYLVIDVPIFAVAGDSFGAGVTIGLLAAPSVGLSAAVAGFLGLLARVGLARITRRGPRPA